MAEGSTIVAPRRGEIHVVSFDPTLGAEIKKTRPALVIQNDIGNRHSPITIVAAITSKVDEDLYPTEVPVRKGEGDLTADSVILLNQIRSIDTRAWCWSGSSSTAGGPLSLGPRLHVAHRQAPLAYNRGRARVEARRRLPMTLATPQGRIRGLCNDLDGNTLEFQPATV